MRLKYLFFLICFSYIGIYFLNTFFGGYYLKPVVDGARHYKSTLGGLSIPLAIEWQPYFGYHSKSRTDKLGYLFLPLITIDRKIWHPTKYADESDIEEWLSLIKEEGKIHPHTNYK